MVVILKYQVKNKFTAASIVNKPAAFVKNLLPRGDENYIFCDMSRKSTTISVIGPGRLGGTLACAVAAAGYDVKALGVRHVTDAARELADAVGAALLSPTEAADAADAVFLCCGDDAVENLCQTLVRQGGFLGKNGQYVIHCSGALDSGVLDAAEKCGCMTGSFHPLQTFPDVQAGLARWAGTHCFIETGYPELREFLHELAVKTGAVPHDIDAGQKTLYHAAAALCCNHMTALIDVAMRLFEKTGLGYDEALTAAGPIMRATLENILSKKGSAGALTGPIARGDVETVKKHLNALNSLPETADVYRSLGMATVSLAQRGGLISDDKAATLRRILDER